MATLPRHIAFIMDGNGRWANARGLPRGEGHRKGAQTVQNMVQAAADIGVEYVTFYAFSIENWSRPDDEVSDLMALLRRYLKSETPDLHKKGARLRVIGRRDMLDPDIVKLIEQFEELTKENTKINVTIALSYGGRQEIVDACRRIAQDVSSGRLDAEDIDEAVMTAHMTTCDMPDPDLMIRTSGEMRISNFLLWQSAYTEFYFTKTLWPDFDKQELQTAIAEFQDRERRFGALNAQNA